MKFIIPCFLFAFAGISAAQSCDADYIVERCLQTETPKVDACETTEKDCLCTAYEAVAACYNNCPNDPRAPLAQQQATEFCKKSS